MLLVYTMKSWRDRVHVQLIFKNGGTYCEFDGRSMETETTTWPEFPNGGKAIVEQILASQESKKES